jgi:hypothetical protein
MSDDLRLAGGVKRLHAVVMARPRCDVFDAAAAREAIAGGRSTARQAYEAYCSTAARPYSRSTWELMLRRPKAAAAAAREIIAPWRDIAPAKPAHVLTTMSDRASVFFVCLGERIHNPTGQ